MPRNTTINRRNFGGILKRKSLFVAEPTVEALNKVAAQLKISQGSLTDTAIAYLAALPLPEILLLVYKQGHLTDREFNHIRAELDKEEAEGGEGDGGKADNNNKKEE